MAEVTIEAAQAARERSRRLRVKTVELRLRVRASTRAALVRRERATVVAEARNQKRLAMPTPSPWSDLAWRRDDDELGKALVSVD